MFRYDQLTNYEETLAARDKSRYFNHESDIGQPKHRYR